MRVLLISLLLFYTQLLNASLSCKQVTSAKDLRRDLVGQDIALVKLQEHHRPELKRLFQTDDVAQFYLGLHDNPDQSDIDQYLEFKFLSATTPAHGHRETFNGLWVIMHQGQIAGFINLTQTNSDFMPESIRHNYIKTNDSDLLLGLGYALHKDFRGKGLISRSIPLILEFSKKVLKAKMILASTNNLNYPSKFVLLRAGFIPVIDDGIRTKFSIDLIGLNTN